MDVLFDLEFLHHRLRTIIHYYTCCYFNLWTQNQKYEKPSVAGPLRRNWSRKLNHYKKQFWRFQK